MYTLVYIVLFTTIIISWVLCMCKICGLMCEIPNEYPVETLVEHDKLPTEYKTFVQRNV